MSGGPPHNLKNLAVNIEARGGVVNAPVVLNNRVQGDVKHTFSYKGPPMTPTGGADNVQQREQNVGDNLINIRNEGGILNQPTFEDNVCAGAVNLEAEINIQHPHMEENKDQMDLK